LDQNSQKIYLFSKNLEIQKSEIFELYKKPKTSIVHKCPEKNGEKKLSSGLWLGHELCFFRKAKKTHFKPLRKATIKYASPDILEFFALQNKSKMKKIGDHDLFFDFFKFFLRKRFE
jgi:hypothetical protein